MNFYKTLGLSPTATSSEIRAAYKRLALRYHPDKNPTTDPDHIKKINNAYEILSDTEKRNNYDNSLTNNNNDEEMQEEDEVSTNHYSFSVETSGDQEEVPENHQRHSQPTWLEAAIDALQILNKPSDIQEIVDTIIDNQIKNFTTRTPTASLNAAINKQFWASPIVSYKALNSNKIMYELAEWFDEEEEEDEEMDEEERSENVHYYEDANGVIVIED